MFLAPVLSPTPVAATAPTHAKRCAQGLAAAVTTATHSVVTSNDATATHSVTMTNENATKTDPVTATSNDATKTHSVSVTNENATKTHSVTVTSNDATATHSVTATSNDATKTHSVTVSDCNGHPYFLPRQIVKLSATLFSKIHLETKNQDICEDDC